MRLTLAIYIRPTPQPDRGTLYELRPLFHDGPAVRHRLLSQAMRDIRKGLTTRVRELMHSGDAESLAAMAYSPGLKEHRVDLHLSLRRHTARCRVTVVELGSMGRRLAFLPELPDVWFEIPKGTRLVSRASEVIEEYWRGREKRDEQPDFQEALNLFIQAPKGSITTLDLQVPSATGTRKKRDLSRGMAFLGGEAERLSGYEELHKVGQCLDWSYPDELERAVHRDREVAELVRCLSQADRRPVVLIGRPQAGKTTVIHEAVRRRVEDRNRQKRPSFERNTWAISPARLISGMSFVGQWENRLLAIIKESVRRDHVLYFDDVIGLYYAGASGSSDLAMAQVLKPYVELREIRLLAEMTPEAWRKFQELDRGLADLFHLIRVDELSDEEVYRVLVSASRQMEDRHRCRFSPEVVSAVHDVQRHYNREAAFPGKAASFMRALAVKYAGGEISRQSVIDQFRQKSGLMASVLDTERKLDRQEIVDGLRQRLVGQEEAVEAMADVVGMAKARLADPHRPLAALLFLGPTGVGKTQAAKALAAYLFGDAERMLRIDMNEFVTWDAAGRLIGAWGQPEGLLTSAIRRQPFSVVLLDEIEKAHPAVFDLMLQVLGEGRLTDALGRTADFTNAVVILTSNLGARAAAGRMGFHSATHTSADLSVMYVDAARGFFRPEFFNRLDRVIPFRQLSRQEIAGLAHRLIHEVFTREGLRQRKTLLELHPAAMGRIVEEGYHPELGARALKRVIERNLAQPVANELAAIAPDAPLVVDVYLKGAGVATRIVALAAVERQEFPADDLDLERPREILETTEKVVRRIQEQMSFHRPRGPVTAGDIGPEQAAYFAVMDSLRHTRDQMHEQLRRLTRPSSAHAVMGLGCRMLQWDDRGWGSSTSRRALLTALDLDAYLSELAARAEPIGRSPRQRLSEALQQLALLDCLSSVSADPAGRRGLMIFRAVGGASTGAEELLAKLAGAEMKWFGTIPGWVVQALAPDVGVRAWEIEGPACVALAGRERGTWLITRADQPLQAIQVEVVPLRDNDRAIDAVQDLFQRRSEWFKQLAAGRSEPEDPWRFQSITRLFNDTAVLDLRTGLVQAINHWDLKPLLPPLLSLPIEFAELPG